MSRTLVARSFLLILILTVMPLSAEPPVYSVQKAKELKMRDGIGNTMALLQAEKPVTVAYLGGSITAANGWRPMTTAWLKATWPKSEIKEINAAIGGTGSDLGVYRLDYDVLRHDPDLLFVEFAVNDGGASPENIWKGMEGIVRQTWKKNPKTDIVFVYTIAGNFVKDLEEGNDSRSMGAMDLLADFYGIPSINFGVPVVALIKAEKLIFQSNEKEIPGKIVFSGDNVHPHTAGHEVYAESIKKSFEAMKDSKPVVHDPKLAGSFMPGNWETAKMVPITELMLTGSWHKLKEGEPCYNFTNRTGELWTSATPGDKLTFTFKGTDARIYDLLGPNGGQVFVTVDGVKKEKPIVRFDSYCTYHRLATLFLASGLDPAKEHTITVEIDAQQPSRQPVAFRLKDPEKELAEPKYQGTNVWFGRLMLIESP